MRSMVEREAPPEARIAATSHDGRASLSTSLRLVPLSLAGED